MRRLCSLLVLASGVSIWSAVANGAEPSSFTYSPKPPGSIVESRLVYLAGEGMHNQWRAVISRKPIGTGNNGESFHQYYLSFYQIQESTYHLKFQSPGNGGPLSSVTKAHGANLWFPAQSVRIVGTGEFRAPAVQQLVVQSHEMAADCGSATVTVFAYDEARGRLVPSAVVTNGCSLQAAVVNPTDNAAVRLEGPYYGPNASMCCPISNDERPGGNLHGIRLQGGRQWTAAAVLPAHAVHGARSG